MKNNLSAIARELLATIKEKGFNGVHPSQISVVNEEMDRKEIVDDLEELTGAQFDEWTSNYAVFVIEVDLYPHGAVQLENMPPYVSADFDGLHLDEDGFHRDLLKFIQDKMGDDVNIAFRSGCSEYECIREGAVYPLSEVAAA
jgi:hypothetical protein